MAECRHGMDPSWCADCRSAPASRRSPDRFVWIKPARLYHLPDCAEVLWDPSEAKRPGERMDVTAGEVRKLLSSGEFERGCLKCGARA
jgi:hypothetical protein